MQVIAVVSDLNNVGFKQYFEPSCKFHNLDLQVLECQTYSTHRTKDLLLYEYLTKVDEDELILYSDAYDAFFLNGESEIISRFQAFNTDLVFSSEINCWPDDGLKNKYPANDCHFKYLNAGAFIGKAGFIRQLIDKYPLFSTAIDKHIQSDQYYWHHVYLENMDVIAIDHNCCIFYNTSVNLNVHNFLKYTTMEEFDNLFKIELDKLGDEVVERDDKFYNTITNTFISHIHFAGPVGKRVMSTLDIELLWAVGNKE